MLFFWPHVVSLTSHRAIATAGLTRRISLHLFKLQLPMVACAALLSTSMNRPAQAGGGSLPPSIGKAFVPATILVGATSTLTFTVGNPNVSVPIGGVTFTDTFPAGLVLAATGTQSVSCTAGSTFGGVSATAGGNTVNLSSTTIAAGGSCIISVLVQGTIAGMLNNSVQVFDNTAPGQIANASLQVDPPLPPLISKAFGAATVSLNGTTTLTLTFTNPNATVALTGVGVVDGVPPGLVVATPNGLISTCNGSSVTTLANIITIQPTITLAPSASCTVTVNVTGLVDGPKTNTTQVVMSTNGGPGLTATADIFVGDPFQVRYTANLAIGDSVINFTNTGEGVPPPLLFLNAPVANAPVQNANLCVNVYAFSPDEQLVSCCSCLVTPNGLNSISAVTDLTSNTLTPGRPTSIVVKLLATSGTGATPACNAATAGTPANPLTNGLAAWGTTIHPLPITPGSPAGTFGITETRFVSSTLSTAELTRITALCNFIQVTGSGFGVCKSCRLGGLGASKE